MNPRLLLLSQLPALLGILLAGPTPALAQSCPAPSTVCTWDPASICQRCTSTYYDAGCVPHVTSSCSGGSGGTTVPTFPCPPPSTVCTWDPASICQRCTSTYYDAGCVPHMTSSCS
jgi:hypothetical protein